MEKKIKITYAEQYSKIVGAYLRNELDPYNQCACFIGNLLGDDKWSSARRCPAANWRVPNVVVLVDESRSAEYGKNFISKASMGLYNAYDIAVLEQNFLQIYNTEFSENSLFLAMESTLLMLKEIHEKLGEVIKPYTFTKRLEKVNI